LNLYDEVERNSEGMISFTYHAPVIAGPNGNGLAKARPQLIQDKVVFIEDTPAGACDSEHAG
jgi:hypothetical protein